MVYCINAYRTWIEVADDNLYKEHIISRTDRTDYLVSRTLVLRAFKTNGIHAEGTTWTIPYVASRIRVSASLGEKYMAAFLMRCLNVMSCFR